MPEAVRIRPDAFCTLFWSENSTLFSRKKKEKTKKRVHRGFFNPSTRLLRTQERHVCSSTTPDEEEHTKVEIVRL